MKTFKIVWKFNEWEPNYLYCTVCTAYLSDLSSSVLESCKSLLSCAAEICSAQEQCSEMAAVMRRGACNIVCWVPPGNQD